MISGEIPLTLIHYVVSYTTLEIMFIYTFFPPQQQTKDLSLPWSVHPFPSYSLHNISTALFTVSVLKNMLFHIFSWTPEVNTLSYSDHLAGQMDRSLKRSRQLRSIMTLSISLLHLSVMEDTLWGRQSGGGSWNGCYVQACLCTLERWLCSEPAQGTSKISSCLGPHGHERVPTRSRQHRG